MPLVFVDIETNGLSHVRGKVIELAAIRVENMQITDTFKTLLNPGGPLPEFITGLTGITAEEVAGAPYFSDMAENFTRIMDGAIFVAHNVRFDYSFIKQEFKRMGQDFDPRLLCTVRLSRALYPEHRKHSLQELIARHNLKVADRHRAYDDAHAIYQFFKLAHESITREVLEAALKKQLKLQALPSNIPHELIDNLPNGPGVYIFEDEEHVPIYVGKSIAIRKRVLSHFTDDHSSTKELKISQHIRHIRTIETVGELEALLLESRLVKELQPLYNIKLRKLNKVTLLVGEHDENGYLHVKVDDFDEVDVASLDSILGVFANRGKAKGNLEQARKLFDLCPKLLGLEKTKGACFYSQLGKCSGACVGKEPADAFNERLQLAFKTLRVQQWPYKGPVLIEEHAASEDKSSGVVVDKWCIVAEVSQVPSMDVVEVKKYRRAFDIDTYKILRAFLTGKREGLHIKQLSSQQLSQLLSLA